jgi:uncharacterized protein (DUF362 family)
MKQRKFSRREFLRTSVGAATGVIVGFGALPPLFGEEKSVVSVVKIKNDNIGYAIEKSIDLIGGINTVTAHKERIMLKPNLVSSDPSATTKPEVIKTLAQMMKGAGKEVLIGEGSAAAPGFNFKDGVIYRTKKRELLDGMQQYVFDGLGYSELAKSMGIPLVNLHSGEMSQVKIHNAFVFDEITLHRSLTEVDLLCSVPMMKTHGLAQVTLGMKNLVGVYPGTEYYAVRGLMHDRAAEVESSGTAVAIVDMVRANKLGLVVVDGSMAMEGQGPSMGSLVKMDLIIAGTNPLATDMVSANIMGFEPNEIPTFIWANKAGMKPTRLDEIEVRGEKLNSVRRKFLRPAIYAWNDISGFWGAAEI